MSKRLLLVYPKSFWASFGDMRCVPHLVPRAGLLNASLATVAGLTPGGWNVELVDENVEPIPFDGSYDLVGISGFHTQIFSAERVATLFRSRSVPVVCGGPSVSISPERWRPFSDVLMIGEAERIWPRFVEDFLSGNHRNEYRETEPPPLELSPVPDYSGFSKKVIESHYAGIVQTSRGCPYDCEFCDAIVYLGRKQRYKPVHKILQEVEQIRKMGIRFIVLADDNFSGIRSKAKEILRALRDWNRTQKTPMIFFTQLSIDTAGDEEFLELASEAGLNRVLVGIESPNKESLQEVNKTANLERNLLEDVDRFHQHGILVIGTSILGFDHDTVSAFRDHFVFHMKAGVLNPQPYPLQAPDGTRLRERMIREGRYLETAHTDIPADEVNLYNTLTLIPKQMTVEQLKQGVLWLIRELYKPENVVNRVETFFHQFDNSPKRGRLRILGQGMDRVSLIILWRVIRYAFTRAPKHERDALWRALRRARRSSHPQRFAIALSAFLVMKNVQEILKRIEPEIDALTDPAEDLKPA